MFARLAQYTLVLGIVVGGFSPAPTQAQDDRMRRVAEQNGWKFDYREARRQSEEQNKPLLVVIRCVP